MTRVDKKNRGASLIELLVSLALGLLILSAAATLFKKGMDISLTLSQRAEMQQNARAGINAMVNDAALADTDLPSSSILLPQTAAPVQPRFGCGAAPSGPVNCYLNTATNIFSGGSFYPVNPHQEDGAVTSGLSPVSFTPDTLVVAYVDPAMNLGQVKFSPTGDVTGSQIVVMNPPANIANPTNGITVGDLVMLSQGGTSAIGVVTTFDGISTIDFAVGDPLNINQPPTAVGPGQIIPSTNVAGNITSNLMNANPPNPANPVIPGADGSVPGINAQRVLLVTYFVSQDATGRRMLMRQVNAHLATPIAENVENLQVSYDTINNAVNPPVPVINQRNIGAGSPNLIRKINIALTVRTTKKIGAYGDYQRLTLATSVSPRNMSKTQIF